MSFIISVGRYGGFNFSWGYSSIRLCLGWISFVYIPDDIDDVFGKMQYNPEDIRKDT